MDILLTLLPVAIIGAPFIFWIAMIVHAIKSHTSNKSLWIVLLIFGNIFGAIAYYFAVYEKISKKQGKGLSRRALMIIGTIIVIVIIGILLLGSSARPTKKLKEIPLAEVIRQGNNGEITRIKVKGDELTITKKGDYGSSEHSWKKPGSSIHDQGLTNKDVQVIIKSGDVTPNP